MTDQSGPRQRWTIPPELRSLLAGTKALFWDFDGVIADTEPVQEFSYQAVMSDFGAVPEANFFTPLIGTSEPDIWNVLLAQYSLPATVQELMRRRASIY